MVRLILAFAFNWPLMYAVRISVKECPPTNTTWKARERNFDCISPKVYHCIQDDRGILMETCMTPHLVNPSLKGGCPWALHTESGKTVLGGVFNSCSGTGCPKPDDPEYWTYQLYKYPICLHNDALTTTQTTVSKSPNKKESTSTNLDVLHDSTMSMKDKKLLLLGIALAGLALVLLTVVAVVMCRMKSRQHKGHSENIDVEDGYPLQDKPEETDPFLKEDGEVVENKRMESQVAHQSVMISEVWNTPVEEQQKKARYDTVRNVLIKCHHKILESIKRKDTVLNVIYTLVIIEEDLSKVEAAEIESKTRFIEKAEDIFYSNGNLAKRVFMEGEAGRGKTLFAYKLLDGWCKIQSGVRMGTMQDLLSKFQYIFFVSLPHVIKRLRKITDMVCESLPGQYHGVIRDIIRDENVRCLIILDGLDRWSYLSNYNLFPDSHDLKNCVLFTTSRPWIPEKLRLEYSSLDKFVKVQKMQSKLVEDVTTHNPDSNDKAYESKENSVMKS